MSQPHPLDFDAVLGGQNLPSNDAVVLGGIAGAEQKLAHELKSRSEFEGVTAKKIEQWTLPKPVNLTQERSRLQQIAKGLSERRIECQFIEPVPILLDKLTDRGRNDFDRDIRSLLTNLIIQHFPWDKLGRMALKTTVLFNTYETISPHSKDRDLCLAAIGPDRRSDEQVIRIQLTDLIIVNQNHRWDCCPWLWKNVETPSSELLGTNDHPITEDNNLAIRSLLLLDEGKIEESLGLYGITFSDELHQIVGGEPLISPFYSINIDRTWTNLLVDTLRQSAPWKLPQSLIQEAERLNHWTSQKKSRYPRPPFLKLAIFPNQHYARKTSLILTGDIDGRNPRLIIEETGSNSRLHYTGWKRSIAIDFSRYGIEFV
jgi:hypothetical protein